MARENAGDAGEYAASPLAIPKRGWWEVLLRVKDEITDDNLSIVAAGVAFYGFLAIFPMIGAVMTVFGLIADPSVATRQMEPFQQIVPSKVYEILMQQVRDVTAASDTSLSMGLLFGLSLTLWSSTKGIKALFAALNVAYEEKETRNFFRLNLRALAFTAGGVAFIVISLSAIALIPVVVQFVPLGDMLETALVWLRWPIIAIVVILALAILYRHGPDRRNAKFRWITPSAVAATVLWLGISICFSIYVRNFGNYGETFGSLGAVVVLLFWFYFSALAVCIGAELNSELEMQTYRDSTVGPQRPIGRRGAYVADHTAHDATHR